MGFQISYRKLFSLQLLHEFAVTGKCLDFEILPDAETLLLIKGLKGEVRQSGNILNVLIPENGEGEPYINNSSEKLYRSLYRNKVFRFYLKLKNPYFLNYTNLDLTRVNSAKFVFSNMTGNRKNDLLYLSSEIEELEAKEYQPGDFVIQPGTDQVYEALKVTHGSSTDLNDQSLWVFKGERQYPVLNLDGIIYSSGYYFFNLTVPAKRAEVEIFSLNFELPGITYDVPVCEKKVIYFEENTSKVTVNFTGLNPGKYMVKVNDQTEFIYYDPVFSKINVFGIVEIYNHLNPLSDFSLLDVNEKLISPDYIIHFANRRVLWKFTRKTDNSVRVEDIANAAAFPNAPAGDDFISLFPMPLSEVPVTTLRLNLSSGDPVAPLPNPGWKFLSRQPQDGYEYLCSQIFLNY